MTISEVLPNIADPEVAAIEIQDGKKYLIFIDHGCIDVDALQRADWGESTADVQFIFCFRADQSRPMSDYVSVVKLDEKP